MRILAAILLTSSVLAGGCAQSGDSSNTSKPLLFDGQRAYALVAKQLEFGPRVPGSAAHGQAVEWILASLKDLGWQTETQSFEYEGLEVRNLIARSGPEMGDLYILGAHYDSRPQADQDPISSNSPVPGANDGASGVSVLLELARVLEPDLIHHPLWLVFFDAEDGGGLGNREWAVGSRLFAESLERRPAAVVIVSMVGDADLQLFYEWNSDPSLSRDIWMTAASLGYHAFIPTPKHAMIDDHTPFVERGIPAIDIIDFDYPYWHTTEDTLDKISPQSLEQVGRTLEAWLTTLP